MPDYQGRDENRIEFTPGGEAANYISLDQVLMLAFQHARNNREIYGKFADVELVWALDRAHETGDFYDVRLSYRPAHDFRGRPGVEQFIIPKSGGVEFRQIISEPRPIWWSPFVLSSVGAVLVAGVAIAWPVECRRAGCGTIETGCAGPAYFQRCECRRSGPSGGNGY
jgi:hypothetical protein